MLVLYPILWKKFVVSPNMKAKVINLKKIFANL